MKEVGTTITCIVVEQKEQSKWLKFTKENKGKQSIYFYSCHHHLSIHPFLIYFIIYISALIVPSSAPSPPPPSSSPLTTQKRTNLSRECYLGFNNNNSSTSQLYNNNNNRAYIHAYHTTTDAVSASVFFTQLSTAIHNKQTIIIFFQWCTKDEKSTSRQR